MPFYKQITPSILVVSIICSTLSVSSAQDIDTTQQLMDMDLGQLFNVSISVASKTDESILDSPSSVTVFQDSEIDRYGYYTLRELAEITPG